MKPKILIVGTVPFNSKSTSRAFESYFSKWERDRVAQIFSNTKTPTKGHCETLFQITDQRLVHKRFNRELEVGKIYDYKYLPNEWEDTNLEVDSKIFSKMYMWGSKKRPLVYLIRQEVWKKKYWRSDKLDKWLDDFKPDCVFLSFSDDFFIPEIALYVANRHNIPIISSVGDDYYFNEKKSLSPFYYIYKSRYKKLIKDVFNQEGSAIYIGDKIKNMYNNHFGLDGETVYLSSSIERKEFEIIDKNNPQISYFGNIRLGRANSLYEIGTALGKINSNYILNVYSNEMESKYYEKIAGHPNIRFHGSISYREVQEKTLNSDIVVIVEGFAKQDIDTTRFSLSTKAADSLASGANILVYGSIESGVIEYMKNTKASAVCTSNEQLIASIKHLINNSSFQKENYKNAISVTETNHSLEKSTEIFEELVKRTIAKGLKNA